MRVPHKLSRKVLVQPDMCSAECTIALRLQSVIIAGTSPVPIECDKRWAACVSLASLREPCEDLGACAVEIILAPVSMID